MHQFARKVRREWKCRAVEWMGWRRQRRFLLDYQPEPGRRSPQAERLVSYCLGQFQEKPIVPCTRRLRYLRNRLVLQLESDHESIFLYGHAANPARNFTDQKHVVEALMSQRADIPAGISSWLVRGDGAGKYCDLEQGLHVSGMRSAARQDLVLMPTANRERYLGPKLTKQMDDLRPAWVPWEQKSDTAWWGGALTGDVWRDEEPRTLTRREVLCYFRDQPSDQVRLHLTDVPRRAEVPPGIEAEGHFTKRSAFSHKCLLLLPGNDIASGSSWYFAGNSVVMMPKPHLEHILYFEMQPWEHYVPLENDPADILVKLRWVLEHPEAAQQIVANSHQRLRWLCGPEYLWACNEVLRRIAHRDRNR